MAEPASTSSIGLMGLFVILAGPLAGPYVYILFGATLGAATAMTTKEAASTMHGALFFLRIWGTALLFTGAGTFLLADMVPIPTEYVMGAVAYVIGWRWDWLADRLLPLLLRRFGASEPTEGGPKG